MKREPGLSAMLRLKNEAQFIGYCIESIIDWFDEIVVCLQNSTDSTEAQICRFNDDKIKLYHYEFDSWPNGDGYDKQDATDVRSRTFFYNWCLEKTTRRHVCKWDGDMVAMDWLGDSVRGLIDVGVDIIHMRGVDIVGHELKHIGERKYCASEPRVFSMDYGAHYINGPKCEKITGIGGRATDINKPAFLHFKWAKPIEVATQAWPQDWHKSPHFQNIIKRSIPVDEYRGEYPTCIAGR